MCFHPSQDLFKSQHLVIFTNFLAFFCIYRCQIQPSWWNYGFINNWCVDKCKRILFLLRMLLLMIFGPFIGLPHEWNFKINIFSISPPRITFLPLHFTFTIRNLLLIFPSCDITRFFLSTLGGLARGLIYNSFVLPCLIGIISNSSSSSPSIVCAPSMIIKIPSSGWILMFFIATFINIQKILKPSSRIDFLPNHEEWILAPYIYFPKKQDDPLEKKSY